MAASQAGDSGSSADGDLGQDASSLLLHHIHLFSQGRAGDSTYRYLFDRYYDRVRRFFTRHGHLVEDGRDLTQDTFFRVYRGSGTFETANDFESWLFRIAANVHRNAHRRRHAVKRDAPEESLDHWIETHGSPPPPPQEVPFQSPLDDVLERERRSALASALQQLPPKMRRCYLVYLRHGWPHRDIAQYLGVAEGTVKAHLFQARQRLDELMQPYLGTHRLPREGKAEE